MIGGAELYAQTIEMADRVYLTEVHAEVDADTFFPVLLVDSWTERQTVYQAADDKNQYSFTFRLLERKCD